jgi:hypothetical protein
MPLVGELCGARTVGDLVEAMHVEMGDPVVRVGRIEHDDAQVRSPFPLVHQQTELREDIRIEQIDRGAVEGHPDMSRARFDDA